MPDEPLETIEPDEMMRLHEEEDLAAWQKYRQRVREANFSDVVSHERQLCDRFRALREDRGWSQAEVATKLGGFGMDMHQTTVAKLEKGKRPLRVAEAFALAAIFDLPPAAVFHMPASEQLESREALEKRLRFLDEFIENTRKHYTDAFDEFAQVNAECVLARNEVVLGLKEWARGEHSETS